jgi:uncharacterized protein (TIGR00255 family)
MIASMTGYGKKILELPGKKLNIEIKSLNSRALDLSVKLPGVFRDKELETRTLLSQKLQRGKIDLYISSDDTSEAPVFHINKELAKKYYLEITGLLNELGEKNHDSLLPVILKMPDVLQTEKTDAEEDDWSVVKRCIEETIELVDEFRMNEGLILEKDMLARVTLILSLLDSIAPFEANRMKDIREKIRTGFQNLCNSENLNVLPDNNRFEQELIYYMERLDITEEKVRLQKHCDYFINTLKDPDSQGKKLGFIIQEMGREINTIGSKANEAEIQKIVVQMKDELEKIKEQLGNIL